MVSNYNSLKLKSRFKYLKENGKRITSCQWLCVNFDSNSDGIVRLGLTVPKYVGSAVLRNKIKRWSKELTRDAVKKKVFNKGVDLNLFFRNRNKDFYKTVSYEEFEKCFKSAINKVVKSSSDSL